MFQHTKARDGETPRPNPKGLAGPPRPIVVVESMGVIMTPREAVEYQLKVIAEKDND